jgi:hypothetical protein
VLRLKGHPELCASADEVNEGSPESSPERSPVWPGSPPQKQEQKIYRLGRPLTAEERAEQLAAALAARERERKQKAAFAELERLKVERKLERQRSARPSSRPSSRPASRPSSRPPSSRREKVLGASTPPTGGAASSRGVGASKGPRSDRIAQGGRRKASDAPTKQQLVRGEGTDFIRTDGRHVQVCDSSFTRAWRSLAR